MIITGKEAEAYCTTMSQDEPSYLYAINRDTQAHVIQPRMLSGHFQGRILSLLSHLIQPQYILEIGTYTGYSALCLAEGMQKNGRLFSIDANEEMISKAEKNIANTHFSSAITLIQGQAAEEIPKLDYQFDLVFIDADKLNYKLYFDLVIDKVRPNGLLLCDNVLWDTKVFDPTKQDTTTQYLKEFNQKIKDDSRVQSVLLPIRDGLYVSRKV